MNDADFLREAIRVSQKSVDIGGYPAGAIVVKNNEIISTGVSDGKQIHDPTSHAETAAIREASKKLQARDLMDVTLYTSLEPCVMCFASSFWAHITRIVFACSREKVSSKYYEGDHNIFELNKSTHRHIELIHLKVLESESLQIIQEWEQSR